MYTEDNKKLKTFALDLIFLYFSGDFLPQVLHILKHCLLLKLT